ncbi:MAG: proline--tRNA ligase [Deltaproteobacteria bacterium]|nr:proline--tRNA ligase [Deltaproteobacteria bacterium]
MKLSQLYLPTLKERPAEAEVVSHQLMLRSGLIRKLAAGIYTYLPLGTRVLAKLKQIIRTEMNAAGAQEIIMPFVQPRELWEESGRWQHYGRELLRIKDRHDHEFCLGPTHEEVITDLIRGEIRSYRQLPINLYQIQSKFRDEIRPRFGLMRGREFIMKDAYSFDVDEDSSAVSYRAMYRAYGRIFARCGLRFRAVEADTGSIGGNFSHEFMVLAETGEDTVVNCSHCRYAANLEKAEMALASGETDTGDENLSAGLEEVLTPGQKTVEEVVVFLQIQPRNLVKTIIFSTDKGPVAALVRGDHEVSPAKLRTYLGANTLDLAEEQLVIEATGAPTGFAGAVGLPIPIYADHSVKGMSNVVMGANKKDYHFKHVNIARDVKIAGFADIRMAEEGAPCPKPDCAGQLIFSRGIEVGHVFRLGTKYSAAMKAAFLDAEGKERPAVMGCYGIGVGRTMAASVEQNHDADGIIWPMPLTPFQVLVLPVSVKPGEVWTAANELYHRLVEAGFEVLLDDRDDRPGVKFKDADLIGIPIRITIGPKALQEQSVEMRDRRTKETRLIKLSQVVDEIKERIRKEMDQIEAALTAIDQSANDL